VERSGTSTFEIVVLALAAVAAAAIGIVWAGASLALLAAGHPRALPLDAAARAARQLPETAGHPAAAWPAPIAELLPGPVLYWTCTGVAAAAVALGAAAAYRRWGGHRVGTTRRRPLGVDARAGFATPTDLAPLTVPGPIRGRFILGRAGRRLLATEDATTNSEHRHRRRRARTGDRGAVALVGPSRCGKTTAAIGGILEWDGPAVLSSVKADLLGATRGWRTHEGQVQVFDPTSTVGRRGTSASWSPVAQSSTTVGSQRAARALCDAAPKGGVEGGMDFWLAQAEILLSALLYVANRTNRDMGALAAWVLVQDRPSDLGPGEVRTALDALLCDPDDAIVTAAADASRSLMGVWDMEERTRSSVYATAQTVVWPWADPGVAASSRGRSIDLPWLLSGRNTVYLCSPIEDQRRLAPAFGGLLNDLINQAYRHVALTGRPIDPPLLIVIDEAGNTPLRSLPEYASTLAGLGVLLVTIWQSIAQLEAAYGRAADTILTNHLSKVFYSGLSDPATLRYLGTVLGDAEVETRSRTASGGPGPTASQWATTRNPLAPVHALRQMQPGDALLLHGTLPPAHIRTRPFYRDRHLAERSHHPIVDRPPAAA
jgi:type IV secretion system protein VirD4